jgi:hypothetical protein
MLLRVFLVICLFSFTDNFKENFLSKHTVVNIIASFRFNFVNVLKYLKIRSCLMKQTFVLINFRDK